MRGARQIDRLFAEHRLAGASAALDQIRMGGGRGADQDGVDVRTLDDIVEGRDLGAGGRGEFLRGGSRAGRRPRRGAHPDELAALRP